MRPLTEDTRHVAGSKRHRSNNTFRGDFRHTIAPSFSVRKQARLPRSNFTETEECVHVRLKNKIFIPLESKIQNEISPVSPTDHLGRKEHKEKIEKKRGVFTGKL